MLLLAVALGYPLTKQWPLLKLLLAAVIEYHPMKQLLLQPAVLGYHLTMYLLLQLLQLLLVALGCQLGLEKQGRLTDCLDWNFVGQLGQHSALLALEEQSDLPLQEHPAFITPQVIRVLVLLG